MSIRERATTQATMHAIARTIDERTIAATQQQPHNGASLRELRDANQARIRLERDGTTATPGGRGLARDGRELSLPGRVFSGLLGPSAAVAVAVLAGVASGFHW